MNAPFAHGLQAESFDESEALDTLARADRPERAFLRAAWFLSGPYPATSIAIARAPSGKPLAAFPLRPRSIGPRALGLRVNEITGPYWPMRGVPVDRDTSAKVLAQALDNAELKAALGMVFRLGPALEDDASLKLLREAAGLAGWRVLSKTVSNLFALDLAALTAGGAWPSTKGQQKDRWRVRQLEKTGPVSLAPFTGTDWTLAVRDSIAAIEAHSWVGQLEQGADTKFMDPDLRATWEEIARDPELGAMIRGSVLCVGDIPAAFTFGLDCGTTRYCIANNFDQRFAKHSPGRILLYDDFTRAAQRGVTWLDWGLGDAGYKQQMGAQAAGTFVDLLFVRGPLLARALRPVWERPLREHGVPA
ncbi:MAG: GNAT family N-acetyltransferase [Pseudomonadota bacterium]